MLLLLSIVCYFGFFSNKSNDDSSLVDVDKTQSTYVKPEEPVDRSKTVSLPGWGSFTIHANTTDINEGFEFHNPDKNYWYEDTITVGDKSEKLVVDSGNKVELNHYLKLDGINSKVVEVINYDKKVFSVEKNEDNNYTLEAIGYFNKDKTIKVKAEDGKEYTIKVSCNSNLYYMTFGLYLKDDDECLYKSGLVSPGNYIQKMKISKKLKHGTYKAYVVCQPYKSDKKTKTNSGVVNIDLIVK